MYFEVEISDAYDKENKALKMGGWAGLSKESIVNLTIKNYSADAGRGDNVVQVPAFEFFRAARKLEEALK